MPMYLLQLLRRRVRKYIYLAVGKKYFDQALIQRLLGYRWKDGVVDDRWGELRIRYRMDSLPGRCVFLGGEYEEEDVQYCLGIFRGLKNPRIVDIGANVGLHSLRWLQWVPHLQMLTVEPGPETFRLLAHNIAINGFSERCQCAQVAISDCSGDAEFIVASDDAFSGLVSNGRVPELRRERVRTQRLGELLDELGVARVDFLKIDVEGAESSVVEGASDVLRRDRPDVFMEICSANNPMVSPDKTIRTMAELGYDVLTFSGGVSERWTKHDDAKANYHFKPRHRH